MSRAFTVVDAEQRSPEWFQARLGRLTGSRAADMLAQINKGESAGRRNLRMQLVLERVTGRRQDSQFVSAAMQQGIDREADAYAFYEALTGQMVSRTGFLRHDALPVGCSIDGHVGDFDGIIEIKCPIAATHWDSLRTGVIPGEYQKQIVHGLWVSGAQWCDWLSYHPEFPEPLQGKLVRVERSEVEIAAYAAKAQAFLAEVENDVQAVRTMTQLPQVLREAAVA